MKHERVETVEVTCRSLPSRLLFRPGPALNEIVIGALARAVRRYGVRLCCFSFVSNHFHLLVEVDAKKSPAPRFHAASKAARLRLYEVYSEFVAACRKAAGLLRAGDRSAPFPAGCFPPALPFVGG